MVKLIGKNKIFCAVFISGRGTNLKSIYKHSKKNYLKFRITLVIVITIMLKELFLQKKIKLILNILNIKIKKNQKIKF